MHVLLARATGIISFVSFFKELLLAFALLDLDDFVHRLGKDISLVHEGVGHIP